MALSYVLLGLSLLASAANAQVAVWGQCGGIGFTGSTTCASGSACVVVNAYYFQCQPGAASTTSATSPTTTASSGSGATATPELNALAQAAGKKYFGSATDNPELTDTAYVKLLSDNKMFGQLTPGNSMKWDATEPSRGTFTFTNGDAIANLAASNGQLLRGHNLCWQNQLPSWVSSGGFNNATLVSILQNHVTNVVSHYKGKIYAWDVVNEPLNDDGSYVSDVFSNTIGGPAFIAIALRAARAADPNAKLCINDYNIESSTAKLNAYVNLVKTLQAWGAPIDCIGFESHLIVNEVPSQSSLEASYNQFANLGLEVQITELDIRMTLPSTSTLLAQQATNYQTVIAACMAVEKCQGITIWDYTDKYSWVPSTFSGQGAALPWDSNLAVKPAQSAIAAALG